MAKQDVLVVQSKIRTYVKKKRCNLGGDVAGALTKEVTRLVDNAISRAKGNNRKTIKGRDI